MRPTLSQTRLTRAGEPAVEAPRAPGVYRFYNDDSALLYVGKSIDIASRLRSHFSDARLPGRQQSMMSSVRHIDYDLTAGEIGALLMENAAIKAEKPLYNRRQRRHRSLWTIRLEENVEGFVAPQACDFCPGGERREAVYGLYRSRHQLVETIRALARDEGLCLRALGLDTGRGPCFQHQIGRCRGACAGRESPAAHNRRLLNRLKRQRIAAWPFAGPIFIREKSSGKYSEGQPAEQLHLLNHWSYQGSFTTLDAVRQALARVEHIRFDRDSYRIALWALRKRADRVFDAHGGTPLGNPLYCNAA